MFATVISTLVDWLYTWILVILLLGAGVWFTLRSRFVQLRLFGEAFRVLGEKTHGNGGVSSFQALMISTASRVGTGNIAGVSTAICLGGVGSVFWMWVVALLGGATAFVESTLAQIYKVPDGRGGSRGGPACYIQQAIGSRTLAVLFSLCLILTYMVGFNLVASYQLVDAFSGYAFFTPATPWILGGLLAVVTAVCLFGGGGRLTRITEVLVPLMGGVYVLAAVVMIALHYQLVPGVLGAIFENAFDFRAIFGGFTGSAMMYGIKRGLFSNEAGVGSAPNAAAAADVSHPVKQGLAQMLSVFLDTLLICSATALLCLCSGVEPEAALRGVPYVQAAMEGTFGPAGSWFITGTMLLFAFTTILGNYYYCESNLPYILRREARPWELTAFRLAAAGVVLLGAQLEFSLVWDLADVTMGLMALVNLPVILRLGGVAMAALRDYRAQRAAGEEPVFRARDIGLSGQTAFWN